MGMLGWTSMQSTNNVIVIDLGYSRSLPETPAAPSALMGTEKQ